MTNEIFGPPIAPPLYIDTANQEVGIGVSTPLSLLHVEKNVADAELIRLARSSTAYLTFLAPAGTPQSLKLRVNGTAVTSQRFHTNDSGAFGTSDVVIVGVAMFDYSQLAMRLDAADASAPDASAILDVISTTKGFLPPRVTTTQKGNIASPATGLVVYDTTLNKLCVYTGAAWQTVTSA